MSLFFTARPFFYAFQSEYCIKNNFKLVCDIENTTWSDKRDCEIALLHSQNWNPTGCLLNSKASGPQDPDFEAE